VADRADGQGDGRGGPRDGRARENDRRARESDRRAREGDRRAREADAQQGDRRAGPALSRPARDGLVLGLAVGTSGLAFGAAAVAAGLSTVQACALSLLAYTGASQFALADAVAGGGLIAGTAGAIMLGSRNALYGLRLADLLRVRGAVRLLAAQGITDESTAVALAQHGRTAARSGFRATFASLYLTWNLATLAGAFGAGRLGSPQSFGLDVVGPAAFLALIWPRLRAGWTERGVGLLGAAMALAATPFLPPGVPVILAAFAALAGALAAPEPEPAPEAGPAR
jgi:predicted branched-subunit amino acid permease